MTSNKRILWLALPLLMALLLLGGCGDDAEMEPMDGTKDQVSFNAWVINAVENPSDDTDPVDINALDFQYDDAEGVFDALFDS